MIIFPLRINIPVFRLSGIYNRSQSAGGEVAELPCLSSSPIDMMDNIK